VRISVPVLRPGDEFIHWLSVEVEDDVVVFYIDNMELCRTDYDKLEELMAGISLLWGEEKMVKARPDKAEA
jgi:hypothetical protein